MGVRMEERLNKLLARAGVSSRRGAEELIEAGRIQVNGEVVTAPGTKVNVRTDEIRLDGERLHLKPQPHRYLALYKPRHVITTASDPFDRATVMDFVDPDVRLYPVGRLDGESEGLILLTNDGELANQLTHPRYEHEKEYRVKISGTPLERTLQAWREGVWLDGERTLPAEVVVESSTGGGTWLRFTLREGKNRQIRRMVEAFNHAIHRLIRLRVGPILVGGLKPGQWRALTEAELEALHTGSNEPIYPDAASRKEEGRRPRERPQYKAGWARPKPRPGRSRPAQRKAAPSEGRARRPRRRGRDA